MGAALVGQGTHPRHGVSSFERVQMRMMYRMPRAEVLGTESLLRDQVGSQTSEIGADTTVGSALEQTDLQAELALARPPRAAGSFERVQMKGAIVNGRAAMPPPK